MDRRKFCRSAVAVSVTAALYGCDRQAPEATQASAPPAAAPADTSMPAISLDGNEIELSRAAVRELGESLSGPVLTSGPDYDAARAIWNGMHDKHPALIARCLNNDDVSRAVSFARDNDLLLAVRGGGHSWPGKSVCDGGLMLDLSQMNRVTVDRDARRAMAGGGALLNALDTATLREGLVTTAGVVSHTGVGGFTLGGGYGRLNRSYGLTIDNLVGATLVTADGQVRRVSADSDPDLFWAIRGGGGNFGVVTEFEYALHPFDRNVLSGNIVWPVAEARDVLEHYAENANSYSREMYIGPVMAELPDVGQVFALEVVYNGDPAQGERELEAIRSIGTPIVDEVKVQDYMVMQTQEDASLAHGIRSYAKNGMVREWSQGLVDALVEAWEAPIFFATHTAGGAVADVGETDTAFPHRNAEIMLVFLAGWTDPEQDEAMIAGTRELFAAAEPFMGGYYDNIEYDRDAATGNFGPVHTRLARIKGEYDPGNLFRLNSNITPA
jgi:FAD/FMN-containing dehydrogenase